MIALVQKNLSIIVLSLSYLRTKLDVSFSNDASFSHPPCFWGTKSLGEVNKGIYGLPALREQILNIWMIQTTQDISTQSKPLIAEKADFIGQIKKGSTNQMLRFRIFQIFRICTLRAGDPYGIFWKRNE
jgi:hypothetical protein